MKNCARSTFASSCSLVFRPAFTLMEVMVAVGLIAILMSVLIPVLGKARESARFTSWRTLSKNLESDARMTLYYNFEDQSAEDLNAAGEMIVRNKATGDPMGLVASEQSMFGAQDPELRYGVLKESHPTNKNKGALPTYEVGEGRFLGKTAMQFYGKTTDSTKVAKEGSYIRPDFWAGILDNGEFQIAMWMKLNSFAPFQKPVSWGDWDRSSSETKAIGDFFAISGNSVTNGVDTLRIQTDGVSSRKFAGKTVSVFDGDWHYLVVRLAKPYGEDGLYSDPEIPEIRDIEISIDGSDYFKPSTNPKHLLATKVNEFIIGTRADSTKEYIQGYIDEVAIWQEPLPIDEVRRMYRSSAPMGHERAQWQN